MNLIHETELGDGDDLPIKYSTSSTYMLFAVAATYLSKVVHSSYREFVDVDAGKQAFNACLSILRKCSAEDNDMPGRCGRVVAQVWNIHQGLDGQIQMPPSLKVTSRMFYSIVYDSLCLWREKYAGQPANGAPPLPPPFIPSSPSAHSSSIHALPSPAASSTQSHHATTSAASQSLPLQGHESLTDVNNLVSSLPTVGPSGELLTPMDGDTNSLGDMGFFGLFSPDMAQSNVTIPDFNMTSTDSLW